MSTLTDKNLVVYDLETTGVDKSKDRILQIAAIKYDWNTKKIIDAFNSYVKPVGEGWSISYAAYAVHGIGKDKIENAPTFEEIGPKFIEFVKGCNIATYNGCKFDNSMLYREFERVGIKFDISDFTNYDSFMVEKSRHGNTLHDVFERYYHKKMEDCGLNPHDALSDVKGTLAVLIKQNEEEPIEPMPTCISRDGVISIHDFECNDDIEWFKKWNHTKCACFDCGKYRGMPVEFVANIDKGYIAWAVGDNCGFDDRTKNFLKQYVSF